MIQNKEIIDGFLKEFAGLAKHPRPSHHEKEVSDYIVQRFRDLGIQDVVQDEVYNVIANVPVAAGCEHWPLTLLQGHMDMVCVAKPGVAYDPLTSEIKLIVEDNILRADGTSLGADDGVAVAMIFYVLQQDVKHGPLRIIFTVDEEMGMTGAKHLEAAYVQDVKYVINCDSEDINIICVSSAGSVHTDFRRNIQWQAPHSSKAVKITLKGLRGGHSGETINEGKGNAVTGLAGILLQLQQGGIAYGLASIAGGTAPNAIPSQAEAVINVTADDVEKVRMIAEKAKQEFTAVYGDVEKNVQVTVTEVPIPSRVVADADAKAVVQLLTVLHVGVFAMNRTLPTLPDLSANIGSVQMKDNVLAVHYFPRASSDARLRELMRSLPVFAELTGFTVDIAEPAPAWNRKAESALLPLIAEEYERENGKAPKVEAIHGGLETGYFYALNPKLDIVSIGPATHDIHSPYESVELDSVASLTRILMRTLAKLKQ